MFYTQPKSMKVVFFIIATILFVICIIVYPFKMKGAVHINIVENIGFAVVKVFNIRLFSGRLKMTSGGKLSLEKEKNKKKNNKNKTLKHHYFLSLMKKVEVKKAELFFNGGTERDVYLVSIVSGYINVFVTSIFAVFMNKYKHMKTFISVEPDFERDRLELTASGVISFSLLDMFLSFIHGVYYMLKERRGKDYARESN